MSYICSIPDCSWMTGHSEVTSCSGAVFKNASIVDARYTSRYTITLPMILVPVFFVLMKERALRKGTLQPTEAKSVTE
jgi:hypothetical protein